MIQLGKPVAGQELGKFKNSQQKETLVITQLFGENKVNFYKNHGMLGHNGIDFRTRLYTEGRAPTFATHDGWVISDARVQSDTKGRYVTIQSRVMSHRGQRFFFRTVHFHLSECFVSVNNFKKDGWWEKWFVKNSNYVRRGQLIGKCGNTGEFTTGAHLHFGLYIYLEQPDGAFKKVIGNGYKGANNPMPYFICNQPMFDGKRYYYKGKVISREVHHNLLKINVGLRT